MANEDRNFAPGDELISEKGIYFNELHDDDFPKIQTLNQLRKGVENSINYSRYLDLHGDTMGYKPLEDRSANKEQHDNNIEIAKNGSLEDIKQIIKEYKMELVNISPYDITEELYFDTKNPVHVNLDDLRIIPNNEIGGIEMASELDINKILTEDERRIDYNKLAENIPSEYQQAYMNYLKQEHDPNRTVDLENIRTVLNYSKSEEPYFPEEEFKHRLTVTREYIGEAYREGNLEAVEKLAPEFEANRKLYSEYLWEDRKDMDFSHDYRELQAENNDGWMSDGEYESRIDSITELEDRHAAVLDGFRDKMEQVVITQTQGMERDLEINTPGIYVYRHPYNDGVPEPFRDIKTLDDLKHEVKEVINAEREVDLTGWNPEDYTDKNVREFHAEYDKEIDKVMNGSMAEVLNTMEKRNIILTQAHPAKLSEEDFAMERNPAFIQRDELKLDGQNLEFTRVELPRNVERQIEVSLGSVQGVKEREQDRGHFAVVKDRFGDNYSMVRVDKTPEGHQLNVKRGFPTLDAAENQMENQLGRESLKPNKEMEKTPSMEMSR